MGPISRTVSDAALILELIVNQTVVALNHVNASYTQFLDADGLRGKRIGFSRDILDTIELAPGKD
jgi:amidase